ncbi:MAG: translation initiation factor IF-2 subunit gamma [Archaeoglobi archaeon]|nr:translation initiation factor IF-2 subunit gamma [Candidatus Mnemosynella sp.]
MPQSVVNIGLVGHVDHGKTTLVKALSGVWTDQHSEEIKRGISIKLGYADTTFRICPNCPDPQRYTVKEICPHCGSRTEELRRVSFVDSPGHETLMATMLSGAALMDGAILVIAATEPCPQPQTKEHLMALEIIGVKNIVIAQNKIDIVTKEEAVEHYRQIKEFVKGTIAERAPIVPISAQQEINIDILIKAIEETIPTPKRDPSKSPLMYVARSFDVNKPGTRPEELKGGVLGGSLMQGRLREGEEIELRPGRRVEAENRVSWVPIRTKISSLMAGGERVKEVYPGGLIGVATTLDPAMTKSDAMVGQVVGHPDEMPPVWETLRMEVQLLERVVGTSEEREVEQLKKGEMLMITVGTATTVGVVQNVKKEYAEIQLRRPICALTGSRAAISRRIGSRWRLIGVGEIKG